MFYVLCGVLVLCVLCGLCQVLTAEHAPELIADGFLVYLLNRDSRRDPGMHINSNGGTINSGREGGGGR